MCVIPKTTKGQISDCWDHTKVHLIFQPDLQGFFCFIISFFYNIRISMHLTVFKDRRKLNGALRRIRSIEIVGLDNVEGNLFCCIVSTRQEKCSGSLWSSGKTTNTKKTDRVPEGYGQILVCKFSLILHCLRITIDTLWVWQTPIVQHNVKLDWHYVKHDWKCNTMLISSWRSLETNLLYKKPFESLSYFSENLRLQQSKPFLIRRTVLLTNRKLWRDRIYLLALN